jgi:hypothetical protein
MNPEQTKNITNKTNSSIQKNVNTNTNEIQKKRNQSNNINQKPPLNQQININNKKRIISKSQNQENIDFQNNNKITNSLIPTPQSSTNKINPYEIQNEKKDFERTQKYINYLKTHLDSSYYAFNEIKNKNSILLAKSKSLNDEIKKSNIIYQKLVKSLELKTKENNDYKTKYEKILEQRKKSNQKFEDLGLDEKIEKLKEKNLILSKENKSKEEIISNLKMTLETLEKNKKEKNKEKKERINELNEEKKSIDQLKLEFDEMGKELIDKNKELEETKKTILYLIAQKEKAGEMLDKLEDNTNK